MIKKIPFILIFVFYANSAFCQDDKFEDEFAAYEESFSKEDTTKIYDPLEKVNRKIFYINDILDINIFEPIAKGYRAHIPKFFRTHLRNFLLNLSSPISAVNSFAQGKLDNGLETMSHFIINSTVGIGGFFNVAEKKKIKYNKEDFGQTLAHYGVKSGPFLVLPILGPSTLRDTSGLVIDTSVNFMGFNMLEIGGNRDALVTDETKIGYAIIDSIDIRESLIDVIDDTRRDSFDLYAAMRSLYIQNRNSKIEK